MRRIKATKAVVLDTGVLSLAADKPDRNATVTALQNWLVSLLAAGIKVYVPEVCNYELRRELIRAGKISSLRRLDTLIENVTYIPLTTPMIYDAAQLWATARNQGTPTAEDAALDGDMLVCAQVLSLNLTGTEYVVATTNTKHLTLFVTAAEWEDIAL